MAVGARAWGVQRFLGSHPSLRRRSRGKTCCRPAFAAGPESDHPPAVQDLGRRRSAAGGRHDRYSNLVGLRCEAQGVGVPSLSGRLLRSKQECELGQEYRFRLGTSFPPDRGGCPLALAFSDA